MVPNTLQRPRNYRSGSGSEMHQCLAPVPAGERLLLAESEGRRSGRGCVRARAARHIPIPITASAPVVRITTSTTDRTARQQVFNQLHAPERHLMRTNTHFATLPACDDISFFIQLLHGHNRPFIAQPIQPVVSALSPKDSFKRNTPFPPRIYEQSHPNQSSPHAAACSQDAAFQRSRWSL